MQVDPRILSFRAVRRVIGLTGLALPIALYAQARLFGGDMQPSISEFYHTAMGDYFVGSLITVGIFLIAYLGYPRAEGETLSDFWISTFAGIGAIGVALFPTTQPVDAPCPPGTMDAANGFTCPTTGFVAHWTSFPVIHFLFAILFFVCIFIICVFLFTKNSSGPDAKRDWSTLENKTYVACGAAILTAMVMLGYYFLAGEARKEALAEVHWVFWWETVGVIAFGISWIVKGDLSGGMKALFTQEDGPA